MSFSEQRSWLVAYDVADPCRLRRVQRYLKRCAIPVQYSVFVAHCDERRLDVILQEIAARIDPTQDDVRAYHLPHACEVVVLGSQYLPDGIMLPAEGVARLLHELTGDSDPDTLDRLGELQREVEDAS